MGKPVLVKKFIQLFSQRGVEV